MVTIKFIRSDKKEFMIDNQTWKIKSNGLVGFDFVGVELGVQNNAMGDGAYISSKRYVQKDRTISARLVNRTQNESQRQIVRNFFNARYTFQVYVTYGNVTRWFDAEIYQVDMPTENIYGFMEFTLTLLSPNPFMYSIDNFAENIASVESLFEFPYISPIGVGFQFGSFAFAQEVEIVNDGDIEAYCKAVFVAKGDVTNPQLVKDDKYIKILDTMSLGDIIEIDLVTTPPKVTKNNENIIRKVDRTSSFQEMAFEVGKSLIGFDADDGSNYLDVTIYFNKRYLGV